MGEMAFAKGGAVARKSNSKSENGDKPDSSQGAEFDGQLPDVTEAEPAIEEAEVVSVSGSGDSDLPMADTSHPDAALNADRGEPEQMTQPDAAAENTPEEAEKHIDADNAPDTAEVPVAEHSADPTPDTSDTVTPPKQHAASPAPDARRGSVLPMLLGGALAAGLGYGAAVITAPELPTMPDISALERDIVALRAAQERSPDLSVIEAEIAALRTAPAVQAFDDTPLRAELAEFRDSLDAISTPDLSGLTARLESLESSQENLANALRDELAAGLSGVGTIRAELDELRDLVTLRLTQAEAAVDAAVARAGLESLIAALQIGAPYPEAVARITASGYDVPAALAAVASSGIRPLEDLQESFPAASRAALRVMLQNMPADSVTDRVTNFFRAQTGARSITPREGDDPDAILSRAAAAVEAGDLATAIAEIETLPETGQAAIASWADAARARLAAFESLPDLIRTLSNE